MKSAGHGNTKAIESMLSRYGNNIRIKTFNNPEQVTFPIGSEGISKLFLIVCSSGDGFENLYFGGTKYDASNASITKVYGTVNPTVAISADKQTVTVDFGLKMWGRTIVISTDY